MIHRGPHDILGQGENLMADPLDHETHKEFLVEIRDALDLIKDHLAEIKEQDREHYKEVREILAEIAKNTEP
jgi:hypothetical protein